MSLDPLKKFRFFFRSPLKFGISVLFFFLYLDWNGLSHALSIPRIVWVTIGRTGSQSILIPVIQEPWALGFAVQLNKYILWNRSFLYVVCERAKGTHFTGCCTHLFVHLCDVPIAYPHHSRVSIPKPGTRTKPPAEKNETMHTRLCQHSPCLVQMYIPGMQTLWPPRYWLQIVT